MKNFLHKIDHRLRESLVICALGNGCVEQARIFLRLVIRLRWPIPMNIHANGTALKLDVFSHEELMLVEEIFCRKTYVFPKITNVRVVVDCGANCGVSTLFLYSMFPSARILAVEPNPQLFERLKRMVAPYSNITPAQCAVGRDDQLATFFVTPKTTVASSLTRRSKEDVVHTVQEKKIETLMKEWDLPTIDVLKFDVEGAESAIFSNPQTHKHIRSCAGEVHEDLMGMSIKEFSDLISETYGYTLTPARKRQRYIVSMWQK